MIVSENDYFHRNSESDTNSVFFTSKVRTTKDELKLFMNKSSTSNVNCEVTANEIRGLQELLQDLNR